MNKVKNNYHKFIFASCITLISASASMLHADLPAFEGFDYTNGSALIQPTGSDGNGGIGWTNRWTGSGLATVVTTSETITFTDGNGNTYGGGNSVSFSGGSTQNAATRTFLASNDTSGGDVYFSYILQVADGVSTGNISSSAFMSVGILDSSINIATDNFAVIAAGKLGARVNNGTSSIATDLQYQTTYLVVGRLSGWDGDSYTETTVWLDPDFDDMNNSSISATSSSISGGADGFRGITFRTANIGSNVFTYDSLTIGDSWEAVVIPEPAHSTAIFAGLGALIFATLIRRRTNKQA